MKDTVPPKRQPLLVNLEPTSLFLVVKILGTLLSGKVPVKTAGDLEGEGGGAPGASTSLNLTPGVPGPTRLNWIIH